VLLAAAPVVVGVAAGPLVAATAIDRSVVVALVQGNVPRAGFRVEPMANGRVTVRNLSTTTKVQVEDHDPLAPSSAKEFSLPLLITIGSKSVQIQSGDGPDGLRSLAEPTLAPGIKTSLPASMLRVKLHQPGGEAVADWFRTVTAVLHSAAVSEDFFERAARALTDLVGLDRGRVLLREGDGWRTVSLAGKEGDEQPVGQPSTRMLQRLLNEKRTFWQSCALLNNEGASLTGVQAVVASPILDARGEVIGTLYGEVGGRTSVRQISELEALLVDTLASGVATGLARLDQQRAAVAAQVRFEQFFTPELSRFLALQPDLLRGRDAEVTLLFCDIRGFSRISERLTPAETVSWIGDTMSALSDCIAATQGVVVDYIGDEVLAMWGAPAEQPNHAQLACQAALAMISAVEVVNQQWQSKLCEPLRVGVGINTGLAHVGNTGSTRKFKYGPLGKEVNLASRVQGATRYLQADVLVTASTHARLAEGNGARRLCKVRVVNISQPVDLYQLPVGETADWARLKQEYEHALGEFEQQNFRVAARILSQLIFDFPNDGPAMALLSRAAVLMASPPEKFSPVWELPGK